jgi:hypothetical protein
VGEEKGQIVSKKLLGKSVASVAALATMAVLVVSAQASAVFPNFAGCVRTGTVACFNVQATSGSMRIKGSDIPLGAVMEIRGSLRDNGPAQLPTLIPATGTNGVIGRPADVPGGLLGIDLPFWINMVTATPELAGSASDITINTSDFSVRLPLKLKLSNPILGPDCHIGSNRSPAWVTLILGTTNPPRPNSPISGRFGTGAIIDGAITVSGNTHVDNSFSIPSATDCGYWPAGVLVDGLVNLKMGLPSAGGNNTMIVNDNLAMKYH